MQELSLTPRISAIYDLQAALLEPYLQKVGLSWVSFQLLSSVNNSEQACSQAEIARHLGVTSATLSESVNSHVAKGLLKQSTTKSDRRVKRLALTPKAKKLLDSIAKEVSSVETDMLSSISATQVAATIKLLDKCISNLEAKL